MKPNWKTEDVPVAENMVATVSIVPTADLPTPLNLTRNSNLSQN